MKGLRLLPLVIIAIGALLVLKGVGLIVGEPNLIGGSGPALAQNAAQETAGEQGDGQDAAGQDAAGQDSSGQDTAGQAGAEQPDGQTGGGKTTANKPPEAAKSEEPSFLERVLGTESRSRDAILDSLGERRKELEEREKELDLRENLLKAAEQRLEQRIAELKDLEARITAVEADRKGEDDERIKNVVTMYESMKPKDAARIFNRLDMSVVSKVASLMSARQMALVLAEMDSEVAQRLTLELSAKSVDPIADTGGTGGELPKIVGTRPVN